MTIQNKNRPDIAAALPIPANRVAISPNKEYIICNLDGKCLLIPTVLGISININEFNMLYSKAVQAE